MYEDLYIPVGPATDDIFEDQQNNKYASELNKLLKSKGSYINVTEGVKFTVHGQKPHTILTCSLFDDKKQRVDTYTFLFRTPLFQDQFKPGRYSNISNIICYEVDRKNH